ncbi:MAG TPA: CBS domain-containing protein [Chitinophagaceae bacterium]|nr:CBS domain-containing protein [Chitinophagaceae bacterium]
MSRIADILQRKGRHALAVPPETTVIDALKIMAEKNIGSIVVMSNDTYLGIMTERDYSRKVILKGKHSDETRVSEIMSTDLPILRPEDKIEFCMQLMSDKNIRYLPVFDSNRLAGIISMSDVVKEIILTQQATISHLESYIHSGL